MKRFLRAAPWTLGAVALLMVSCKPSAPAPAAAAPTPVASVVADKTYAAVGVIQGFDSGNQVIVLSNKTIPGFMDAMTMSYELQPPALAQGFKVGDAVDFTITVRGDDDLVTALKKR